MADVTYREYDSKDGIVKEYGPNGTSYTTGDGKNIVREVTSDQKSKEDDAR